MEPTVRRATPGDAPAILDVLERALGGDPFVSWLARGQERARKSYFRLMLRKIALPRASCTSGWWTGRWRARPSGRRRAPSSSTRPRACCCCRRWSR
ncbi:MAG: hypothetical protein M5U28_12210 [Sandaracinaceae bacterium]|nr:hypothetical protein [Sandaracinaceae bacterium]